MGTSPFEKSLIEIKDGFMWRIEYKGQTLQEVLIMAYMNILDKLSPALAS
jgi:hypothetical protein